MPPCFDTFSYAYHYFRRYADVFAYRRRAIFLSACRQLFADFAAMLRRLRCALPCHYCRHYYLRHLLFDAGLPLSPMPLRAIIYFLRQVT